jgi:hypothetical protein
MTESMLRNNKDAHHGKLPMVYLVLRRGDERSGVYVGSWCHGNRESDSFKSYRNQKVSRSLSYGQEGTQGMKAYRKEYREGRNAGSDTGLRRKQQE